MTRFRSPAVAAALAVLLPLLSASPAAAQQGRTMAPGGLKQIGLALHNTPFEQRTDAFRRILYEFSFTALNDFPELNDAPSQTVLIVLGDTRCLSKAHFPNGLRAFVEQGGAVLIATDTAVVGEARTILEELAGVTLQGETLICPGATDGEVYHNEAFCPIVQPAQRPWNMPDTASLSGVLTAVIGAGSQPALFRDLRPGASGDLRVATNAPSRLRVRGWWLPRGIHELAHLPARCVEENRSVVRIWNDPEHVPQRETPYKRFLGPMRRFVEEKVEEKHEEPPLFAVGGEIGKGRVLVLADHSVFINRMILPADTGNMEFTTNCLHWLRGGATSPAELMRAAASPNGLQAAAGQRDKVLFWDDDRIQTDLNVPLRTTPVPLPSGSQPAIVAAVDQGLARLEDGDHFNRMVFEGLDSLPFTMPRLKQIALCLLTLALVLWGLNRLFFRGRHRLDITVPLLAREVARHVPAVPLLEQRRQAMLRAGNVWETAHQLARHCFETAGVPVSGPPPQIRVTGSACRWQRWLLTRRIHRLWRLARDPHPKRVRPTALQGLLRELEELRTALANGSIQLT